MSEQSPRRGQPAGEAGTRSTDRIVWIDCEMTGLELDHDALVEVACIVTDAELVEAHSRVGAQVATLPLSHPLWQISADMHGILAAELLRRLA